MGNRVTSDTPDRPASRFASISASSLPSGVAAPTPVIQTGSAVSISPHPSVSPTRSIISMRSRPLASVAIVRCDPLARPSSSSASDARSGRAIAIARGRRRSEHSPHRRPPSLDRRDPPEPGPSARHSPACGAFRQRVGNQLGRPAGQDQPHARHDSPSDSQVRAVRNPSATA